VAGQSMDDSRAIAASIILVNYNGVDCIIDCIHSIAAQIQSVNYEIIVVDNASTDGSPDLITKNFPQVHLLKLGKNVGFGAGNNQGAKVAQGQYLFFLNPDTYLTEDPLPSLIQMLETLPDVGIVAPRLIYPDGSLQLSTAWSIGILGEFKNQHRLRHYQQGHDRDQIKQQFAQDHFVDIVVGAAFLMRKQLFVELNGFDETFFMYFDESDLCQRLRERGWKLLYTVKTQLVHLHGQAVKQTPEKMAFEYRRSQLYYYQKHRPLWEQFLLRLYLLIKFGSAAILYRDRLSVSLIQLLLTFPIFKPAYFVSNA
jgi:hypothetical protein